MSLVSVLLLHPRATPDHVGLIPYWLDPNNPAKAAEQLDANYQHGGGWRRMEGFVLSADNSLEYPEDDPLSPLAEIQFRDELILIYDYGVVAVIQPDRSFEACRMD